MKIKVNLTKEQKNILKLKNIGEKEFIENIIYSKLSWMIDRLNRFVEEIGSFSNEKDKVIRDVSFLDRNIDIIKNLDVENIDDKGNFNGKEIEISDDQLKMLLLDMADVQTWFDIAVNSSIERVMWS
jgi:hypothetical protein